MASKPTNNSNMVRFPPWKSWSGEPERETVTKEIRKRGKKYYANCMYMGIRLGECLGTSDERLARRRLEHLRAQIERGEYQIWKRKFSDLAKTYLSEILPKKTEDCQRRYESIVRVHLLPFFGKVDVAYIPSGKIVGLSKIAEVVDIISKKPQLQERMTSQIANTINEAITPRGVLVVLRAEHLCMNMRGVKQGSKTITSAIRGIFLKNDATRLEAFSLLDKESHR